MGGAWRRGAASCDGAAPVTLHCPVVLLKPIGPHTHSKDLFALCVVRPLFHLGLRWAFCSIPRNAQKCRGCTVLCLPLCVHTNMKIDFTFSKMPAPHPTPSGPATVTRISLQMRKCGAQARHRHHCGWLACQCPASIPRASINGNVPTAINRKIKPSLLQAGKGNGPLCKGA